MRKFNLEEAKNGAKVQTRDGREARVLCYGRKHTQYPTIALVTESSGDEYIESFTKEGLAYIGAESAGDLVMAPAEIFTNIYLNSDGDQVAYWEFAHSSEMAAFAAGAAVVEAYFDITSFTTLKGEI